MEKLNDSTNRKKPGDEGRIENNK